DERGQRLIALVKDPPQSTDLVSLGWTGTDFRMHKGRAGPAAGSAWLTPIAEDEGGGVVGLLEGESLLSLLSDDLVPWLRSEEGKLGAAARTGLLFWTTTTDDSTSGCLFCGDDAWCFQASNPIKGKMLHFGWRPGSPLRGLCSAPPLSRLWRG